MFKLAQGTLTLSFTMLHRARSASPQSKTAKRVCKVGLIFTRQTTKMTAVTCRT
jgi:hypothetical protein